MKNNEFFMVRHSNSDYKSHKKIMSINPTDRLNPKDQEENDLTVKGIEKAKSAAEEFFSQLDPKNDCLFSHQVISIGL